MWPGFALGSSSPTPLPEGGLATVEWWINAYGRSSGGWNADYPRVLGDVNGDGLDDIVGFASNGSYLSLSTGSSFDPPQWVHDNFGANYGWQPGVHPRWLGDVNGDGLDDIVGFASGGVLVALSTGNGFGPANQWLAAYGLSTGGWGASNPRILGDVNGDGLDDIVGFGGGGTYLSFSTGSGFTPALWVHGEFGTNHGWQPDVTPRWLGDVDGDGLEDIVGFASGGVLVARSHGNGFEASTLWLAAYGLTTGGWGADYPRVVGDVNGDGLADVVGFASTGTFVSYSNGSSFEPAQLVHDQFGANTGWQTWVHPRWIADVDGNGQGDVVGFSEWSVTVARADYEAATPAPAPLVCTTEAAGAQALDLVFSSFGTGSDDPTFVDAFDLDRNGLFDAADVDLLRTDLTGEAKTCSGADGVGDGGSGDTAPIPESLVDPSAELFCGAGGAVAVKPIYFPTSCDFASLQLTTWMWLPLDTRIDPERIRKAVERARAAGRVLVHLEQLLYNLDNELPITPELIESALDDLISLLGDRFPKLKEALELLKEGVDLVGSTQDLLDLVGNTFNFLERIEEAREDPVKAAELFADYLRLLKWIAEKFGGPVGVVMGAFLEPFADVIDGAVPALDFIQDTTKSRRQQGLDAVDEALGNGASDETRAIAEEFLDDVAEEPPAVEPESEMSDEERKALHADNQVHMKLWKLQEETERVEEAEEKVRELEAALEKARARRAAKAAEPVENEIDQNLLNADLKRHDEHIEKLEQDLERARQELEMLRRFQRTAAEELGEALHHWFERQRELQSKKVFDQTLENTGDTFAAETAATRMAALIPPVEAFCEVDHPAWDDFGALPVMVSVTQPAPAPSGSAGPEADATAPDPTPSVSTDSVPVEPPPTTLTLDPPAPPPATSISTDPIPLTQSLPDSFTLDPALSTGGTSTGAISIAPTTSTEAFSQPEALGLLF